MTAIAIVLQGGGFDDVAEHMAGELAKLSESVWHKFDKDDETTWPQEDSHYWVYTTHGRTARAEWIDVENWNSATHWMPIEVPQPPTEGEE